MHATAAHRASAQEKILRLALAAALVFSGVFFALSAPSQKAYADQGTLEITPYKLDFKQIGPNGTEPWANSRFKINGQITFCIDITTHAKNGASYTSQSMDATMALKIGLYRKYLQETYPGWSDLKRDGYLQYMIWCEYMPDYMAANVEPVSANQNVFSIYNAAKDYYNAHKHQYDAKGTEWISSTSQNVCGIPTLIPKGNIELVKTSGITHITNGNDCYSLAGAVYTVYSNSACTTSVGTITTDNNGKGTLSYISPGTYWVKETTPSPGYSLDSTAYEVVVKSGETVSVNGQAGVVEIPQSNPVSMLLGKVDATTNANRPEGAATLEGAQFSVAYYDGYYSDAASAEASGTPTASWTFKTDANGYAYYSDEYKVSGDAFYYQSDGSTAALPLGTVVVQETQAPVGYNLDNGSGGAPAKFCIQITSGGKVTESVNTYNSPTQPDSVKRGDFRLVKEASTSVEGNSDNPQESERVLVPGIQFQLINDNEHAVVSPTTQKEVETGGVVCTITVDENGLATTKALTLPTGWTGALAYGTYTVHEVIPQKVADDFMTEWGHTLIPAPDWKVVIADEGQYDAPALVNNCIPQTPLKIVKQDAETGKQIPLQCSFQLKDAKGNLVTYTSHYPETVTMGTWTTNEKGEVTLPMLLSEGLYTIVEVQAPEGYALNTEGKSFTVGTVYNGWDNPITVNFDDVAQKGIIKVIKHDSTTSEGVSDSTYIVKAATDIVTPEGTVRAKAGDIVATLVTDASGQAVTPELYLGSYTVYEAKAADGYALNVNEQTVALEYQGQEVSVFTREVPVTNTPTEIKLHKVDATNADTPVAGAKFRVWNDDGSFDKEYITDSDGNISIKYIPHGTYHVQETAASDGYVIFDLDDSGNAKIHDFTVNDQGMISFDGATTTTDVFEWTVKNMPKSMTSTAIDQTSGTHEGQAGEEMTIVDTVAYSGCIPKNEYTLTGTLMDKATGKKVLDANGKEITASTTFTAEDFTGSAQVVFTFDGSNLAGHDVVVFQTMTYEGKEYMVHADINDANQTVDIIDLHTVAINLATGDNVGSTAETLDLVDTVTYTNLTPGATYTLITTLVSTATGKEIVDSEGNPITVETKFTPEAENGTVDVPMTVPTEGVAGYTLVFFEQLLNAEGTTIATHKDADDKEQSIFFAGLRSNALDPDDGDKNILADEEATVVDTVTYSNLVPQKEYVLAGRLVDKATGEVLKDANGKEITTTVTFTPEQADGTVEAVFKFDGTNLSSKTAVAFQTLTKNDVEVARHADINDEAQTVTFEKPHEKTTHEQYPGKGYPKTGGNAAMVARDLNVIMLIGCGILGILYAMNRRRKSSINSVHEKMHSKK